MQSVFAVIPAEKIANHQKLLHFTDAVSVAPWRFTRGPSVLAHGAAIDP